MMVPPVAGAARMRSIVERPIPVSRCTRCLLRPAPTAARTRASRSRVTMAHSLSICSASAGDMSYTLHVACETINLISGLPPTRDERGDRLRGGLSELLGHLGVDVHRERDSRMAEHLADHLWLHLGRQEHRRRTMAKVVEPNRREAGPAGQSAEPDADPFRPQRRPILAGEHPARIGPGAVPRQPLGELPLARRPP